jgi:AAA15 family ATPase/GTPase
MLNNRFKGEIIKMTTLEHLTITNFRGFDSLKIDGFSKINLFVGKNNSGKTSVLEAVFLLLGMSNPMLPNNINLFRGVNNINLLKLAELNLQNNTAKQLRYLFHNLSLENHPIFYGKFSDTMERQLELSPIFQQNDFLKDISSLSIPNISGIELSFSFKTKQSRNQSYKSAIVFGENGILSQTLPKNYHETLNATFLAADQRERGTLSRLSEIVKRKGGDAILHTLQSAFGENILGFQPLEDGIFFNLKDVEEYVHIAVMGDGIRRFLDIVTSVFEKPNSFICIDEIENGLHYSIYKWLWKNLITFSNQNNAQLFITSHNIETLVCLKSVLEEEQFASMQEYIRVFNVSPTSNSGHKVYKYSFEGFKDAIEHETEMRN